MGESRSAKAAAEGHLLLAVTLVAAFAAFLGQLGAYDLWWHLKAGQIIQARWQVPHADPFSFTAAGRPWVYHSWLSGLILWWVWGLGGATGLVLLRAAIASASSRDSSIVPSLVSSTPASLVAE